MSGQASGESRLEDSLKKVDAMWKDLDLICVQHRDSRDTFVVEGTEDVQAVLDESNVSISTIAASRHLGPLKSKIDDWIAKLSLFEKTWEEFLACQASWKYLEVSFTFQLREVKMFIWFKLFRQFFLLPTFNVNCRTKQKFFKESIKTGKH